MARRPIVARFTIAMLIVISSFVVQIASAQQRAPRKELLVIGGGGERGDKVNQFDAGLPSFLSLAKRGWNTKLHWDFEHQSSFERRKFLKLDQTIQNIRPLTEMSVLNSFTNLTDELLRPDSDWQSGDQLLIAVSTHGLLTKDGAHVLSLAGRQNANMMEDLKGVIAAAQKRGIKLGIVLDSCFSGDALTEILGAADHQKPICVISNSARNRISYGLIDHSPGNLLQTLADSENLEAGFLKFRTARSSLNFDVPQLPEISNPAGRFALEETRQITRYLFPGDQNSLFKIVPPPQCSSPESPLYSNASFLKEALRSNVAKSAIGHYSNRELSTTRERFQELKKEKDELELEYAKLESFPGHDMNSCTKSIDRADLSSLRKQFVDALRFHEPRGTGRDLWGKLDLPAIALSEELFKNEICSLIFFQGGMLDVAGAARDLGRLEKLLKITKDPSSKWSQLGKLAETDWEFAMYALRLPRDEKEIQALYQRQKARISQLNDLWRSESVRGFLLMARRNRESETPIREKLDKVHAEFRTPESIVFEREAWFQMYSQYKKKNPRQQDHCRDFGL